MMAAIRRRASLCMHRRARLLTIVGFQVALLACTDRSASPPRLAAPSAPHGPAATAIQVPLAEVAVPSGPGWTSDHDPVMGDLTFQERQELSSLYEPDGYAPHWIDVAGRPSASARDALALLDGAAADGLDLDDYGPGQLGALAATLDASPPPVDVVARFDVGLSLATVRYFRDLHIGRVDPRAVGFLMTVSPEVHDFGVLLRSALAEGRIDGDRRGAHAAIRPVPRPPADARPIPIPRR